MHLQLPSYVQPGAAHARPRSVAHQHSFLAESILQTDPSGRLFLPIYWGRKSWRVRASWRPPLPAAFAEGETEAQKGEGARQSSHCDPGRVGNRTEPQGEGPRSWEWNVDKAQRRSGCPSLHVATRALVFGIPGWCSGGRAQAGPWASILLVLAPSRAQPLPLLSVFVGCPVWLGSWSLPVSSPRWRTKVNHSRQGLTEVEPRPYLTGLVSIPAGRCLISLPGVGVSSLTSLIPTSLLLFCPK